MSLAVEARKELATSICRLLALLAVETVHATLPVKGSAAVSKKHAALHKVLAERRAWVHTFVDSIITVLEVSPEVAADIRATVETAYDDSVVVTQPEGQEFVVVRTLEKTISDLAVELEDLTDKNKVANREAWLQLFFRVLVTEQVDRRCYDARARASLKRLVKRLSTFSWKSMAAIESKTAEAHMQMFEDGLMVAEGNRNSGRYVKVALAALGGGALLMQAGSMAAPSVAASLVALCTAGGSLPTLGAITSAFFSYLGLTSTSAISTLFGATGAGLTGYKMSKRMLGVTEFRFVPLHSSSPPMEPDESDRKEAQGPTDAGLPVFICIPGWIDEGMDVHALWGGTGAFIEGTITGLEADIDKGVEVAATRGGDTTLETAQECEGMVGHPGESDVDSADDWDKMAGSWQVLKEASRGWWRDAIPAGEEHVLVWESELLNELHKGMREFIWNTASRYAINELIKLTALSTVTTAAALPMYILNAAAKLDDPWDLAMARSMEAGQLLADVLASRPQGSRPVTLVGYSMGARVIFYCLEALYEKGAQGQGIIENAVLLGAPIGTHVASWKKVRSVVAGRLISGYLPEDWVLGTLFRTRLWDLGVAGLSPVGGGFVENVDLSDLIREKGFHVMPHLDHLSLSTALPRIMARLHLED